LCVLHPGAGGTGRGQGESVSRGGGELVEVLSRNKLIKRRERVRNVQIKGECEIEEV
jgi:hypothetical protein